MRIGIFTESYWPVTNGVSTSVETFRVELEKRGHRIHIFCTAYPGHVDSHNGITRFPSVRVPLRRYYPIPIPVSPEAHRKFKEFKPDIVHTMSPFMLGQLGMRWGRDAGVPIISTNHTLYTEYAHYMPIVPMAVTRAYLVRLMRRFYSLCDEVLVPSSPVRDLLRSWGIETPIDITPTPMKHVEADPAWRGEVRSQYGIPPDSVVAIYVGRIAAEKNIRLLVDAFQMAAARAKSDARLLLVGSGPFESACRGIVADRGLSDRVSFTGWLSHEDALKCYAASDFLAHPSVTETQGLTVGEAMGLGLPTVAGRAYGSLDAIEQGVNGLLAENTAAAFADAMLTLFDDEAVRRTMSIAAMEKVIMYSPEVIVGRLIRTYETLCNGRKVEVA